MPLSPGARLGPYEILAAVGAGGMGEVYRARDSRLDRDVAIKVLPPAFAEEPLRRRRFEQEARAIAALNHPHVCHIHDVGPDYLVLEYVDGEPLAGPLSAYDAVHLAIQIASALEAAHRRGILHRDLKPSNILVTRTDEGTASVKLLDFGLARLLTQDDDTRTSDAIIAGTAAYMSPEQAEGKPLDARSDIFGFGAVLYEMLAGRRAFTGASAVHTLAAVAGAEPENLVAPPLVSDIVRRCLQKQPTQRFQTAADVRTALESALRALTPATVEPRRQQPSIAVLPFANLSADKENEYFSDGLAEEIINLLAQVPGLTVIARTSAFAFRDRNEDVRRIAELLGVTTIVEGSVRRAGNRLRVTAQLITASDGGHLWSQRYDRELTDVFAIQDDIAEAIASALKVKLSLEPRRHGGTTNLAAYEACLRGRYYWAQLTPESLDRSRQLFEEAVALDPQFAAPYCYLGEDLFATALSPMTDDDRGLLFDKAKSAAATALRLDPSMLEAHALLGSLAGVCERDWSEAARRFDLAMAGEAITPHTRVHYGLHLLWMGRIEESLRQYQRAVDEDPLNAASRLNIVGCLAVLRRTREAAEHLRKIVGFEENAWAQMLLALIHFIDGNLAEASESARIAHSRVRWLPFISGLLAGLLERSGELAEAQSVLAELSPPDAPGVPIAWTIYHLARNEPDRAADWFEKAIQQREPWLTFQLLRLGFFDENPRRLELLRMLKLVA
jgi:serine/threonine-protein kinase